MEEYHLERLNDYNAVKWEEFNKNSNEGSFFHSLKWKQIIEHSFDFKTHYFLLYKNNDMYGIFPFIEQKNIFFNGLTPAIGSGHRNAIIQDSSDSTGIQYMLNEFQKKYEKKFSYICLSTLHEQLIDNLKKNYPVFPYSNDGNMIINLKESPPENIWQNLSKKRKQKIRNFDKKGYSLTELKSFDELKLFYNYYKKNLLFIGGTPHKFSHFTYLWNNLSSAEMRIILLSKDLTFAGGQLIFLSVPQKTVYFRYLSLNRNLPHHLSPSDYLYWEVIKWAWDNNFEKLSFGAQHLDENNPRYRIKKEFGGKFEPIYSKMIPLTNTFTIVKKCKQYIDRMHFFLLNYSKS